MSRKVLFVLALAMAIVLAACSSDNDGVGISDPNEEEVAPSSATVQQDQEVQELPSASDINESLDAAVAQLVDEGLVSGDKAIELLGTKTKLPSSFGENAQMGVDFQATSPSYLALLRAVNTLSGANVVGSDKLHELLLVSTPIAPGNLLWRHNNTHEGEYWYTPKKFIDDPSTSGWEPLNPPDRANFDWTDEDGRRINTLGRDPKNVGVPDYVNPAYAGDSIGLFDLERGEKYCLHADQFSVLQLHPGLGGSGAMGEEDLDVTFEYDSSIVRYKRWGSHGYDYPELVVAISLAGVEHEVDGYRMGLAPLPEPSGPAPAYVSEGACDNLVTDTP